MPSLREADKEIIANLYYAGATQVALANQYGVSRRTIQDALVEHNLLAPIGMGNVMKRKGYKMFTQDQQQILEIAKDHSISASRFKQIIDAPADYNSMVTTFTNWTAQQKLDFILDVHVREKEQGVRNGHSIKEVSYAQRA
jgi:transposase